MKKYNGGSTYSKSSTYKKKYGILIIYASGYKTALQRQRVIIKVQTWFVNQGNHNPSHFEFFCIKLMDVSDFHKINVSSCPDDSL